MKGIALQTRLLVLGAGLCFLILGGKVMAQQSDEEGRDKMPATFTFGGFLSTQGGGGHLDYGFGRGKQQIMVSLDAYTLHDRRETKIESDFKEQGGPYTFGKLNYVFIVSPTIGIQRNLFPDEDRNLIGFHVSAQIGPSIAFLIPYKVDIFTPIAGRPQFGRKVVENYDPSRHGYEDIIRRAKVFDGDLEAENQIGLSIRTNLYLDLSKNPEYLSGVRIGVNADVYPDELPIMGITENKKSYITGTVGLIFGFKSN